MRDNRIEEIAEGYGRACQGGRGVLSPQVREMLSDFNRLKTEAARAAYAHRWIRLSTVRLNELWPAFYELLSLIEQGELYRDVTYMGAPGEVTRTFDSFPEYFEAMVKQPFAVWAELEETYGFVQENCPEVFGATYTEAREHLSRVRATVVQAAADEKTGEVRPEGRPNKLAKLASLPQGEKARRNGVSHCTQRTLDHLARDFPELHERVKTGELSAHRAGILAGFIRVPTELELLRKSWRKATLEERREFRAWIDEE